MVSKSEKLFERMKNSSAGWKREDIDSLYLGFGFIIRSGNNHDIATHPDFPSLRATLPRHKSIAKCYIKDAIENIKKLNISRQEKESENK